MRIIVLVLLPFLLVLASCKKENDPKTPTPQPTQQLKVDSTSLALKGNIGSKDSFNIESNGNWTIAVNPSTTTWLETSKNSGTSNTKIYVTVEQNNTSEADKTATIIVTPEGETSKAVTITIT
jgi:nitrous oxide reductase accessory protein NosL